MRYLDPKTSRWLSTDPALAEYIPGAPVNDEARKRNGNLPGLGGVYNTINLHLYHYAGNNPIKYTDPDGREAYLVIWATSQTDVGHAGFAVDNYGEDGTPDGTVTYYDLWPGNEGGVGSDNVTKDVEAYYGVSIMNKSDLYNTDPSQAEGRTPDGVIEFETDIKTDNDTKAALEKFMNSSDKYNGKSRNCSDMAKIGVQSSIGSKANLGKERFFIFSFTTPNKLFSDSKKQKNANVIVDPENKIEFKFSKIIKQAIID